MGYEVEVKYRGVDRETLIKKLDALNAQGGPTSVQEDAYLKHPSRDFAQTNEAFRIRRVGASNYITYKGPRQPGPTKTREEIEIAFAPGDETYHALVRLLHSLGFQPAATVRKTRSVYAIRFGGCDIEVAIDDVEGLGTFAEVEVLVANDEGLAAAQTAVLALSRELELVQVEPRSYLRMVLERLGA